MSLEENLKKEFDAEDGSFLLLVRCELRWDKEAFSSLTSLMFDAAKKYNNATDIPKWLAEGFWFCDTWIKEWTSHQNFPSPEREYHKSSCELIHDLSYYLFIGESPYEDNTLEMLAK